MTAKATGRKPAAKRPATRPTARPALPQAVPNEEVEGLEVDPTGVAVLHIPSDDAEDTEPERVPMFYIGDVEYTVLANPPASIGLEAVHIVSRGGGSPIAQAMADDYVMTEMLGEHAYAAFRQSRKVTPEQRRWVSMKVSQMAMGALEDPKN